MRRVHGLALLGVLASACVGTIGDGSGGGGGVGGIGSTGTPGGTIAAACSADYAPGHVAIHRLTNAEYDNTVRDLLYTTTTPGKSFDPTPAGQSGFQNDSNNLAISDDLVAEYYAAAEQLAKSVLASKAAPGGAYGKLVTCPPSPACAQATIAILAARAYRRPATPGELATLMNVVQQDADFDTGIEDAIIAILMNPKFLFVHTTDPRSRTAGATFAVDDYALAARLSYALWQTMPDDALEKLAADGSLHDPQTLQAQVVRMLGDPKVGSFLRSLRDDWAGLRTLADPAGSLVGLDDGVRTAMVGEVDAFLQDLVAGDRSFLNVLTGDYAFVNGTMAAYYGIAFPGGDPNTFARVSAPPDRAGLVTSPAILTATAGDVAYTHPVHRGKFITDKIICNPPPPPPPGVPPVNFDPTQGGTPRQKLEAHANNPACIGCHQVMDTLGLGLENYGPFGKWRDAYPGIAGGIDVGGTLPDGKAFARPLEMMGDVAQDDATRACLAQKLLGYAVTRAMTSPDDRCVSKVIGLTAITPAGKFSDLMTLIVESHQFLMQTGEAP